MRPSALLRMEGDVSFSGPSLTNQASSRGYRTVTDTWIKALKKSIHVARSESLPVTATAATVALIQGRTNELFETRSGAGSPSLRFARASKRTLLAAE